MAQDGRRIDMTQWLLVFPLVMNLHSAAHLPQVDVVVPMSSAEDCQAHLALATEMAKEREVPAPQCWPVEK